MGSSNRMVVGSLDEVLPPFVSNIVNANSHEGNIFFKSCGNETLLIGMKFPTALYFQGILDINVLAGKLNINGYQCESTDSRLPIRAYELSDSSSNFLSPAANSIMCRSNIDQYGHSVTLKGMLDKMYDDIQPVGCILCVASKKSEYGHWKLCLERHRFDLFPNYNKALGISISNPAEVALNCVMDIEEGIRIPRKIKFSDEFVDLAGELTTSYIHQVESGSTFKTVVCGGKDVGKSTFLRYVTNKFLCTIPAILYIDLDIGQAEFTLGGCVSAIIVRQPLFGSNYTHLTEPIRSYFVGDVNPMQCLHKYQLAVKELIEFCSEDDQCNGLPWLVNTMGMTKGLGLGIISSVISRIRPNHVVQISSHKQVDNFSVELTSEYLRSYTPVLDHTPLHDISYKHHLISSIGKLQHTIIRTGSFPSSKRLRELMAVIYFSKVLTETESDVYSSDDDRHHPCKKWQRSIPERLVKTKLITGDIVAFCKKENSLDICLGYGIIYDCTNSTVLTPVEEEVMRQTDVLHKSPISFKETVILKHFKAIYGKMPYYGTFNMEKLNSCNDQNIMKALFALD